MLKSVLTLGGAFAASLLIAAGPALAADAPDAAAKPQRACFWTRNVSNWSAADDHTVYIRVGVKDVYRLDLMGTCPNVDWSWKLGLESRGSSFICSALDATIIARGPGGPQRCPVQTVTKLTPVEVAALPKKQRP